MKRQVTANGRSGEIESNGPRVRYKSEDGTEIERQYSLART